MSSGFDLDKLPSLDLLELAGDRFPLHLAIWSEIPCLPRVDSPVALSAPLSLAAVHSPPWAACAGDAAHLAGEDPSQPLVAMPSQVSVTTGVSVPSASPGASGLPAAIPAVCQPLPVSSPRLQGLRPRTAEQHSRAAPAPEPSPPDSDSQASDQESSPHGAVSPDESSEPVRACLPCRYSMHATRKALLEPHARPA